MTEIKSNTLNEWNAYFKDRAVSPEIIKEYLSYAETLLDKNIPVIFEIEHLSKLIGISYPIMCKMVNGSNSFYRTFSIQKRRGGRREINAPYPSLLMCQDWIHHNILKRSEVHHCSQGFVEGKSIISNASTHLNRKALLKMDIKDFFPSIPINWVINFFHGLGYSENVSYYLASLCCLDDSLPQGAATSPYLSNILLFSLDNRLERISNSYSLKYTRYADDLTFSGNYIPHSFIKIIEDIITDFGLSANHEKTKLHTKPGQRIVTGISVTGERIALPRSKKRSLRKEVYFIKKFGLLSHLGKLKSKEPNYLESLEGKLGFWLQIEPNCEFARESIEFIRNLK